LTKSYTASHNVIPCTEALSAMRAIFFCGQLRDEHGRLPHDPVDQQSQIHDRQQSTSAASRDDAK
jgi:hypothetical protein